MVLVPDHTLRPSWMHVHYLRFFFYFSYIYLSPFNSFFFPSPDDVPTGSCKVNVEQHQYVCDCDFFWSGDACSQISTSFAFVLSSLAFIVVIGMVSLRYYYQAGIQVGRVMSCHFMNVGG